MKTPKVNTRFAEAGFMVLPSWTKGVIALAVLGAVGFVAYKLYKVAGTVKQEGGSRQETNAANQELEQLNNEGKVPKLKPAQHQAIANKLEVAFSGMGTDWGAVKSAFETIKTYPDMLAVIKAYGTRTIPSGTFLIADYTGTLTGACTSELDSSERKDINAILKKNGVDFTI